MRACCGHDNKEIIFVHELIVNIYNLDCKTGCIIMGQ